MVFDISSLIQVFYYLAGAFFLAIALTPILTDYLYSKKLWKQPRQTAVSGESATVYQSLHNKKHRSIPTMAGVLIWGVVVLITLLFNLDRAGTYLPLFTILAFGMLGLVDDKINISGNTKVAGLRLIWKLFFTLSLAFIGRSEER